MLKIKINVTYTDKNKVDYVMIRLSYINNDKNEVDRVLIS